MTERKPEIYRSELGRPPTSEEIREWANRPPESINTDIEDNCNLRCPHCALPGQLTRRQEQIDRGEPVHPVHMNANLIIEALDELIETWDPPPAIQITANGEPLMHPQRERIICYPAKLGLNVGLTTNGVLLSPELTAAFCRAGVRMINVSLDAASPETYAKVRPAPNQRTNHFDRVVSNIREAVRARDELSKKERVPTQIMINMIIRPETVDEQSDFLELGKNLGVDKISMRPLNTNASLTDATGSMPEIKTDSQGAITHIDGLKRWACHFPFKRLNLGIGLGGQIRVTWCPHGWDRKEFDIGFYPTDGTLEHLWESPQFVKIRKAHLEQAIAADLPCATCPDWFFVTRTGEKQATYAEIMKG